MTNEELNQEKLKEQRLHEMKHQLMIRLISLMDPESQEAEELSYPAAIVRLRELLLTDQDVQ
jgi:hypothetical protein